MKAGSGMSSTSPYLLLIISALIGIGPFTMEAYLPAIPTIATELGVSIVQVNLSISTFLLGLAFGQLIGGPISDQTGRKNNVVIGLSLFSLSSIGIMFTHDIHHIQLLRFFQALGGGYAAVVGMPTVRDIYEPEVAARKMPLVSSVMLIAPMVAPIFGAIVMQWDWRAIFGCLAVLALSVLVSYGYQVPETRQQTGPVSLKRIFWQYLAVFRHRVDGRHIGIRYIFLSAFSSGVFLTFLTNAAWTYLDYFHVSEFQFPLFFLVHTVAFLLANLVVSRVLEFVDAFRMLRFAIVAQLLSVTLLLALAWFTDIGLYTYVVIVGLVVASGALISNGAMAMLFTYFHQLTGSASSLMAFFRFITGAALGMLSGLLFDHTLIPIVGTMLASSLACFCLARSLPATTLRDAAALPRQDGL